MNFGYSNIQDIIYKNAMRMKYPQAAKFAKDTAKLIWAMIEEKEGGNMDNFWNEAHGFPAELEQIVRKLESGLGISLLRKPELIDVYQWIKEQDEGGKHIKRFIEWATGPEQAKFIGKYRFNPGLIKVDFQYAFENKDGYNPLGIEVGF